MPRLTHSCLFDTQLQLVRRGSSLHPHHHPQHQLHPQVIILPSSTSLRLRHTPVVCPTRLKRVSLLSLICSLFAHAATTTAVTTKATLTPDRTPGTKQSKPSSRMMIVLLLFISQSVHEVRNITKCGSFLSLCSYEYSSISSPTSYDPKSYRSNRYDIKHRLV